MAARTCKHRHRGRLSIRHNCSVSVPLGGGGGPAHQYEARQGGPVKVQAGVKALCGAQAEPSCASSWRQQQGRWRLGRRPSWLQALLVGVGHQQHSSKGREGQRRCRSLDLAMRRQCMAAHTPRPSIPVVLKLGVAPCRHAPPAFFRRGGLGRTAMCAATVRRPRRLKSAAAPGWLGDGNLVKAPTEACSVASAVDQRTLTLVP